MDSKLITVVLCLVIGLSVGVAVGMGITNPLDSENYSESSLETSTSQQLTGKVAIGSLLPLTGDLSTHGEEGVIATKLAVTDFNNFLEKIGAEWNLVIVNEDSATNPVIALEKLSSLKAKGIDIVVGPQSSAEVRNIKGYADSNDVLLFSPSSTATELAIAGDNIYRLISSDDKQGPALSRLVHTKDIQILIPVWRGDAWGDGLSKNTVESFVGSGGMIDEGIRYNPESVEYSVTLSLLAEKVEHYTDTFDTENIGILLISFAEAVQIMQSADSYDILDDVRWFGTDGNTKEDRIIQDPVALRFAQDTQFTTTQPAMDVNPIYKHVEKYIINKIGRSPNSYAYSSYDAVWIIGLTILHTQSTDISTIKETIPDVTKNHYGAIGSTMLNDAGDLLGGDYEIWTIKDGDWVRIGKYSQISDQIS